MCGFVGCKEGREQEEGEKEEGEEEEMRRETNKRYVNDEGRENAILKNK